MSRDVTLKVVRIFKLLNFLSEFPPKPVDRLAKILNVSPKTVYKDIHIIESLGYEIEKDDQYRYHIKYRDQYTYKLDDNEKKLIIGLVKEAGLSTNIISSITQKLKSQNYPDASNLKIMKQLYITRLLLESIEHKIVVILKDYQSTTIGSKIRNRKVLPLYFDDMRMAVTAYDFDKAEPRIFKVARMTNIVPVTEQTTLDLPMEMPIVDTFGYAGKMAFEVSILLTKRAHAILTEEFIMSGNHITSSIDTNYPYFYKSRVCGYEGIGRFVLGLMTEIKVVGDEGFKGYLRGKIDNQCVI